MALRRKSSTAKPLPLRIARLHWKLLTSIAIGIVVALAAWPAPWQTPTKLLAGWDTGVLVYLVFIYSLARTGDIKRLRERAAEEDEGAAVLLLLTCIAAVASLGAIVAELGSVKGAGSLETAGYVALSMGTILLSWAFVHTTFALHYAHEFYGEGRDRKTGGVKFPGGRKPDYWDFIYFSLVIAMTSQVSDVSIESHAIRRLAAMHGVLSFFFNLGVLALTVNMMSNLIA
jgi:uncharacterized membrane protein